jgi:serine/threonine protein kinase/Tol biopolymer transport system component
MLMSEVNEQNENRQKGKADEPTLSFDGSVTGPGSQIGPFRIERELGRGAVGVVYLAHDTKLDRSVAIKSLPAEVMANPKARSRFSREARLLASVNHPNIATIHEVLEEVEGVGYLVLEYVPGQTLAERIGKSKLKLQETLTIALQIAEAIAAAHEHDVIHRDLKPGNIKITPEGKVKVLDFGLAKVVGGEAADQHSTITEPGRVIGTPAYMSPEQARGQATDKRCDIWSFGCVLYEMLTGQIPFKGETISDTLANILQTEPDWHALPQATSANIQVLVRRCLEKDPRRRLQHIGDASIEIDETLSLPATVPPVTISSVAIPRPAGVRRLIAGIAFVVSVSVAASLVTWYLTSPKPPAPAASMCFDIGLPEGTNLPRGVGTNIAISPDGKAIVYVAANTSGRQLYLRRMNELGSTPIPGTEGSRKPVFSPDGAWVAFVDDLERMKKVSLSGDELYLLCDSVGEASWGDDGYIIFAREGSLWRIRDIGGEPELVAKPMPDRGVSWLRRPVVLPGNKAVLFEIGNDGFGGIGVLSIENNEVILVSAHGSEPVYSHTGHIIFPRGDTLVAVPFDIEAFEVTGQAVPVLNGVRVENGGAIQADISRNGLLVYVPAGTTMGTQLAWVNRDGGNLEPLTTQWRLFSAPRLSPDGEQIAVAINDGGNTDIWIVDVTTGRMHRLTTSGDASAPVWTPDGACVTFASGFVESFAIRKTPADGSGSVETLLESQYWVQPEAWHPDGGQLVFGENSTGNNLFVLDMQDRSRKALLDSDFSEHSAALSHDGKWLAYESNMGGSNEVYVRPFSGSGPETAVSIGGGHGPTWSPDDSELYYKVSDELYFMAASLQSDPRFRVIGQEKLFESVRFWNAIFGANYDVSPDGQRFLVLNMRSEDEEVGKINVVLNWFEELKRRAPPG